jgi:peptide/nickel transport system substrate-binding protein
MATKSDAPKYRRKKSSISRRQFMKVAVVGGTGIGLAACGGKLATPTAEQPVATQEPTQAPVATEAPTTAPVVTEAPTQAPVATKAKRVMRVASSESGGVKETMDPAFNAVDTDATRCALVYDRLFRVDPTFTAQPELAESWSPNEDATVWTVKLRKGVKFHNGADFSAKDVLFTYKRLLDPALASPAAATLSAITPEGLEAPDDYTVTFKLAESLVDLPMIITTRHTYIVPDGSKSEELRLKGIGTGPFKQVEFTPGELRATFDKNENYWEPGLPKADAIELLSITEGTARNSSLQSGELDVAMEVDLVGLDAIKDDPNIKIISSKSPYVILLCAWADTKPFDDNRVREAMKYCMDRDVIIETVTLGHANVANDHPVAPWVKYAWQVEPRKQDYEKAKQLLKDAGYETGLNLELYTGEAAPGMVRLAQVYKEMAAPAGINVEVKQTPADSYWSEVWMQKPFSASAWSGRPADEALFIAYYSKAEWNETHWKNTEFDNAILTARKTVDETKRSELYQKAQQILMSDGGALIPIFLDSLAATRTDVTGWEVHPTKYVKDFRYVTFTD